MHYTALVGVGSRGDPSILVSSCVRPCNCALGALNMDTSPTYIFPAMICMPRLRSSRIHILSSYKQWHVKYLNSTLEIQPESSQPQGAYRTHGFEIVYKYFPNTMLRKCILFIILKRSAVALT